MGVRDTDMPEASSLNGSELVAIVQNGENRIVKIGDLFNKYITDLAPWVGQGESALDIWRRIYGTPSSTEQDFLAWLTASIEIDNTFTRNSPYVVASAAEAIALLNRIKALEESSLTKTSADAYYTTKATGTSLQQQITAIQNWIANHGSDGSISPDVLAELQAQLARILELRNLADKIYTWSAIQDIYRTGDIPTDIYNDSTSALVDAKVGYELLKLLRSIEKRVQDLEGGSGSGSGGGSGDGGGQGGGGTDGYTYQLVIEADDDKDEMNAVDTLNLYAYYDTYEGDRRVGHLNVSASENCIWLDNNAYVEVQGGVVTSNNPLQEIQPVTVTAVYNNIQAQYEITVRKVGGDDQQVAEPYITINPSGTVVVDSDGFFSNGEGASNYKEFAVTVNNATASTGTWKIASGQDFTWFTAEKNASTSTLKVSNVNWYGSRTETRSQTITLCLESDPNCTASVTIQQLAMGYSEMDFRIISQDSAATSHMFPGIGDEHIIVVQSPTEWVIDWESVPSWVTITHYVMNSSSRTPVASDYVGSAGETALRLTVEASETDHSAVPIICTYSDDPSVRALYYISQDTTISNVIKLRDTDGLNQVVFNYLGDDSYGLVLTASGDWTATCAHHWFKFVSGTGYTVVDDYTATGNATTDGPISLNIEVSECEGWGGRVSGIKATLDDTGLFTWCYVIQNENENAYSAVLYPVPGTDTYALTVYGGSQGHPSWYVFLDRPGYSPASYIHFPQDLWKTDTWGWTEVQCPYDVDAIRGITIDADNIPSGTEYVEIKINIANGQGTTVYARLAVDEITGRADDQSEGETPVVYNTLDATLSGSSTVSADTTSVTIHVDSTTGWTAAETIHNKNVNPASSLAAGATTADIVVNIGENTDTSSGKSFSVTITSADNTCVPPYKTIQFSQSAAIPAATFNVPDEVTIQSGRRGTGGMYIFSSVPWKLEHGSGYTSYTISPSSGNAVSNGYITLTTSSTSSVIYDTQGTLVFKQLINGSYEVVKTITVIKYGTQPSSTISTDVPSVTIPAAGNLSDPEVVYVTVTPTGSTWSAGVISGDSNALVKSVDTTDNTLSLSAGENSSSSDRSWTVRLYNGTTANCDVTVSQGHTGTDPTPGPTPDPTDYSDCSISLSPSTIPYDDADAHSGISVAVTVTGTNNSTAPWTASLPGTGCGIDSGTTGTGSGTIICYIPANSATQAPADYALSVQLDNNTSGTRTAYCLISQTQSSLTIVTQPIEKTFNDSDAHTNQTLSVVLNGPASQSQTWTASGTGNVTVTSGSGTGNGTITYDVDSNADSTSTPGTSEQTGSITVETTTSGQATAISYTCDVYQKVPAAPVQTQFTVEDSSHNTVTELEFESSGDSYTIFVTCNKDWSVSSSTSNWLNVSPSGGTANTPVALTVSIGTIQPGQSYIGGVYGTADGDGGLEVTLVDCSYDDGSPQ